jgi:DNA-binding CsgD family transcriptional regulator
MTNEPTGRKYSVLTNAPLPFEAELRPPFQAHGTQQLYIVGHLPGDLGLDLLPPGLDPVPGNVWVVGFYKTREGWGLGPFSAFYAGIAVKGYDAPSGLEGVFMVAGRNSGRAGEVFSAGYNRLIRPGDVDFAMTDTGAIGEAKLDEGPGVAQVRAAPGAEIPFWESGTSSYLGTDASGGLIQWTVAFSMNYAMTTDVDLSFDLPDDHRLAPLSQMQVSQTLYIRSMTQSFSGPTPVGATAVPQNDGMVVLDLLAHLNHAVAIVEDTGRILYLSPAAEAILGPRRPHSLMIANNRLPSRQAANPSLSDVPPVALLNLSSGAKVLATAFPIALRLSDTPARMILLNDPHRPGNADPEPPLRLMGLTPSEAAIAALIGQGATPAEAAAARGITASTARSTLKLVFAKLGLRRQAELAQIVTRLQMR